MRKLSLVSAGATAVALCLGAACGDTETTPCTTIIQTNTGGQGGAGGGGTGTAAIGEHCKVHGDCASGLCLDEEHSGWGTGYCAQFCNSVVTCPDGSMCVSAGSSLGQICLVECDPAGTGAECQPLGQGCFDFGDGTGVCVGGCGAAQDCPDMKGCDPQGGLVDAAQTAFGTCTCTDNTGCPTLGNCEMEWGGYCAELEVCDNTDDDDGDALTDCEDAEDCATTCAAQYTAACGAAVAAQASNAGDTTGGTSVFVGSCTGGSGALERIYTYTPSSATAYLHVGLLSTNTDQGIYLRTSCSDAATELACQDMALAGSAEDLYYQVSSTDPLFIFVDGYEGSTSAGAFTLAVAEMAQSAESEPNNTYQNANAATASSIITASITPTTDADWFSVVVPANGTLSAAIVERAASTCVMGNIDSEIEILQSDGTTQVAYNDDNNMLDYCSSVNAPALAAGTYYVRVANGPYATAGATFDYYLAISVQ